MRTSNIRRDHARVGAWMASRGSNTLAFAGTVATEPVRVPALI